MSSGVIQIPNFISVATNFPMEFKIYGVRNPLSLAPSDGFTVSIGDSNGGDIYQQTGAKFSVTQAATINGISIASSPSTVAEDATHFITFKVPVPFETGCKIKFTLPPEINLNNASLTQY